MLGQRWLVTPTGAGGTGKTRTAVELARLRVEDFPEGTPLVLDNCERLLDSCARPPVGTLYAPNLTGSLPCTASRLARPRSGLSTSDSCLIQPRVTQSLVP